MEEHVGSYFDEDGVYHIHPKDPIGAMVLRYFESQVAKYGADKMVVVHTEVPKKLGIPEE